MFLTKQLYSLKHSVGSTETPECNTGSDFYIKCLVEQIDYLKEENKIIISIIQSLLYQNSSRAANSRIKNNNNNNSSSFSYSEAAVYPNVNNIDKHDDLLTNESINNNSKTASDDDNNNIDNCNGGNNSNKKRSVILTLSLKRNKILPKGVKRSLPKIIINLMTILAVKKRRAILNLSLKLMILSVRTIK